MQEGLLHTRFDHVAKNTIDYWMKRDTHDLTYADVNLAIEQATWSARSTCQLYLHVPYCAQHCSFCAFSGGNSLDFNSAERYSRLLVWETQELVRKTHAAGKHIRGVNIGGGSPDLLRGNIRHVLSAIRNLPGVDDTTEISVELTLSTAQDDFLDALCEFNVTKASFGIQAIDPGIRKDLRMPEEMRNFERVSKRLAGGVPVVNVDLMTGLPGQTVTSVVSDLQYFMNHPFVNSISTYLLTLGAGPRLIGDIQVGNAPARPAEIEQALFRLHSYATLLRNGWVRKGTNTYMHPERVPNHAFDAVAGNECIGARRYEAFLIGCGAQAVSSLPGARIENTVDVKVWASDVESGRHSFALPKCSLEHQSDMALWVFPLMSDGLATEEYDTLVKAGHLTQEQTANFEAFQREGLIIRSGDRYQLSIVGEVFMGHLVRELKKSEDRAAVDGYIDEGYALGALLAEGKVPSLNEINDRQKATRYLQMPS